MEHAFLDLSILRACYFFRFGILLSLLQEKQLPANFRIQGTGPWILLGKHR